MKRLFVALVLNLFVISGAYALPVYPVYPRAGRKSLWEMTDKERDGLVGPVQSVRREVARFSEKSGKRVEGQREVRWSKAYNRKGNWTEWCHYDHKGSLRSKRVYTYGADGKLVEVKSYSREGMLRQKDICVYNAKGNLVRREHCSSDGSQKWEDTYAYDAKGRRTQDISYNADGAFRNRSFFTYDADGNLREVVWFQNSAEGALEAKRIIRLDRYMNKTEERCYNAEGSLRYKTVLKNTYGVSGRTMEGGYYLADGSLKEKYRCTYDVKGNVTEEATYNADGSLPRKDCYVYEFDSHGNWIKQTKSQRVGREGKWSFEPVQVTYRTITYYDENAEQEIK